MIQLDMKASTLTEHVEIFKLGQIGMDRMIQHAVN